MIKGRLVGLRAVEKDDLHRLLEWRNNPDYRKYFREYRELNMDDQIKWFENRILADEHTRMFAIVDLQNGELIGACGLCYIDWINRSADFSIYIGKNDVYIDEEYAVDSAKVLIEYGFEELNLNRIWSEIYEIDSLKKSFFAKLGFTHEATHISTHWTGGKWVDSLFFRLLRDEYERK